MKITLKAYFTKQGESQEFSVFVYLCLARFFLHSSRHLAFSYHFLFPKHRWYRCTTMRRKRRTNSEFPIFFEFLVFQNEITSWFQLCKSALYHKKVNFCWKFSIKSNMEIIILLGILVFIMKFVQIGILLAFLAIYVYFQTRGPQLRRNR